MSKVKSAIITSLTVIVIIVAAVFGTISFNVSNTQRYNSIAASINLGADFSGSAYTTLYPEGVISAEEYGYLSEEDKDGYVAYGGVYVDSEKYDESERLSLATSVKSDAEIISERFSEKGLSSYSVSVEDGITIKISIPTNYSYAAYKGNNSTTRSEALSAATSALTYIPADGRFTLRSSDSTITTSDDSSTTHSNRRDEYTNTALTSDGSPTYSLTKVTEDVNDFFKSVSTFTVGTTTAISFDLTELGQERLRDITTLVASSSSQVLYFYLGETLMLSVSCDSTINSDKLQFTANDAELAQNTAIALNSAVNGKALSVKYNDIDSVLSSTASAGENAALFTLIACIVLVVAFIVAAVIRYKKLGLVVGMSIAIFALAMLYSFYLVGIQLTFAVILTAFAGLILFCASNVIVFEEVRAQCKKGRTLQAAVKTAYKRTLMTVADIHIVLIVAAIICAFVAVGEVASCGLISVIAVLASYVLYWFTRFMWYVCSANQRDKFGFGGFKREVYGDD
ncbi:MAG: hypothetical protein ACI4L9_00460 [Candidatus Coproplasma sp.]